MVRKYSLHVFRKLIQLVQHRWDLQTSQLWKKKSTLIIGQFTSDRYNFFLFLDISKIFQVDYGSTAEELEQHFHGCGALNRVTIICDKYSGQPKGFAYIEFTEKESVDAAIALDGSMFRDRQIKVMPKRTNKPGVR
jgi:RNA recognition motif-containing protein